MGAEIATGWVPKREPYMPLPAEPHLPAVYDDADVHAFRQLNMGTADAVQQRRCMEWIAFASGYTGPSYLPGGEDGSRAAAHAEGKRWLMIQIARIASARTRNQSDSEQG